MATHTKIQAKHTHKHIYTQSLHSHPKFIYKQTRLLVASKNVIIHLISATPSLILYHLPAAMLTVCLSTHEPASVLNKRASK